MLYLRDIPELSVFLEARSFSGLVHRSSTMPTVPPAPPQCFFLQIPTEIRLQIYRELLTLPVPILVGKSRGVWMHIDCSEPQLHLHPQIIATCQCIFDESHLLLYRLNTLSFQSLSHCHYFLRHRLGTVNRFAVRHLSLLLDVSGDQCFWPSLVRMHFQTLLIDYARYGLGPGFFDWSWIKRTANMDTLERLTIKVDPRHRYFGHARDKTLWMVSNSFKEDSWIVKKSQSSEGDIEIEIQRLKSKISPPARLRRSPRSRGVC